jgi:hypothetical protein
MAAGPIRKLILHSHGHGHPSLSFRIPPQMVIKYFGEFGKICSVQTRFPAKRICRSIDIVARTASPINRAYLEDPPPSLEQPGAAHQCNEEGCSFAVANKNTLTRHIHTQHVPRGSFNDVAGLEQSFRASRKNRGFIINSSKNIEDIMLFSPRITEARSHAGNTVFPDLFIGTDEHNKNNPVLAYRKTTLEECDGYTTRILLNLEDHITAHGKIRHGVPNPFTTVNPESRALPGSRLLLSDIVDYSNNLYPGERVDLYIIMCLDAIPEATIRRVEESVQEAERPWRGLMNLGRVASSLPYIRPSRARSRSANRRRHNNSHSANRRRKNNTRRGRQPSSRSASHLHEEGE